MWRHLGSNAPWDWNFAMETRHYFSWDRVSLKRSPTFLIILISWHWQILKVTCLLTVGIHGHVVGLWSDLIMFQGCLLRSLNLDLLWCWAHTSQIEIIWIINPERNFKRNKKSLFLCFWCIAECSMVVSGVVIDGKKKLLKCAGNALVFSSVGLWKITMTGTYIHNTANERK